MRNSRSMIQSCALLACAGLSSAALAEGPSQPSYFSPLTGKPVYLDEAAVAPAAPMDPTLMGVLKLTPVGQTLDKAGITISGHIQGSYEYNFNVRDRSPNLDRAFDLFENNKGDINQIELAIERLVDTSSKNFDFGGKVELLYGGDARYVVSSKFFDSQGPISTNSAVTPGPGAKSSNGFARQEAWFDIHQLYADILVPVGEGVRVRVGKFEFFKKLDPNASTFYTHPIEYANSFPFTLTGISAMTSITKKVSIEGGISRGWEQTLTDNNGAAIDGFGRIKWKIDKASSLAVAAITGPEQFRDSQHFTTAVDVTYQNALTDDFLLVVDATYGHQSGAQFGGFPGLNFFTGPNAGAANWYGINVDGTYKLNPLVSLSGRLEWYRDEEGYSLNATDATGATRQGLNVYEVTIGASLTPLHATSIADNFILRPEIRYDYASKNFFHSGARHDQLTIAIDAIFNF